MVWCFVVFFCPVLCTGHWGWGRGYHGLSRGPGNPPKLSHGPGHPKNFHTDLGISKKLSYRPGSHSKKKGAKLRASAASDNCSVNCVSITANNSAFHFFSMRCRRKRCALFVPAVSNFAAQYNFNAISIAMPLMKPIYPPSSWVPSSLSSSVFAGAMFGQVLDASASCNPPTNNLEPGYTWVRG